MIKDIALLLGELEKKLNGYVVLMSYRFMNLCVKSEPASMLPIQVELDGDLYNLDQICDITQPNEYQLILYPKTEEIINEVSKAVIYVHPEFKQERMVVLDNEDQEEVLEQDAPKGTEVLCRSIRLTMPVVNKDRHDLLTDGVKLLYDDAKAKVEANCVSYTDKIALTLRNHPNFDKEVDEAKEELESVRKKYLELATGNRDLKLEEIEDAYKKYLEDEKQKQAAAQDQQAGMSMEMPQAPEAPEMPEMPEAPEMPQAPEMPEAPKMPEMPEAPKMPEMPQ